MDRKYASPGEIAEEVAAALFPPPAPPVESGPRGPLEWHRRRGEAWAAETGEAVLLFPEGCPGPNAEGPHLPCLLLEKGSPVVKGAERIAPPEEKVGV